MSEGHTSPGDLVGSAEMLHILWQLLTGRNPRGHGHSQARVQASPFKQGGEPKRCRALEVEEERKPLSTREVKQVKDKRKTCTTILFLASSAPAIHEVCEHQHSGGTGVLKGSPRLQKIFLLCCLGNSLLVFVFFHFSSAAL